MNKLFHRYNRKIWIVFLITLIVSIVLFPQLPEQIPVHFNSAGEVDRLGSRWTIFLFPGINFMMIVLAEVFRRIDPKSEAYQKFESHYYNIIFLVNLLMLGIQIITVLYVFDFGINISRIMPVAMGVLFIFLGNIMPKFKHNYFVGIKTSWTLASETVWYHTHRLAGKLWVLGGLLMIVLSIFPLEYISWGFIAIAAVIVIAPLIASYYYFRRFEK